MLTCYLSYKAFKALSATTRRDVHLFNSFLNVIHSNATKTVIITSDKETAVNDEELFDLLFSLYSERHPIIISDVEFEDMEVNLFNHGRSLVIYGDSRTKRLLINETGVLHARADDTEAIKAIFKSLIYHDTFTPHGSGVVFKKIPQLPILSIYYQEPFLGKQKHHALINNVNRIICGLVEGNPDIFYNNECFLTLVYSKKVALSDIDLKTLEESIKAVICEPLFSKTNIKLKVDFCEGFYDTHARLLLSDYFVCTADNAFTNNVPIDFVGYVANKNKYKLAYAEIAKSVGGEKKVRIIAP